MLTRYSSSILARNAAATSSLSGPSTQVALQNSSTRIDSCAARERRHAPRQGHAHERSAACSRRTVYTLFSMRSPRSTCVAAARERRRGWRARAGGARLAQVLRAVHDRRRLAERQAVVVIRQLRLGGRQLVDLDAHLVALRARGAPGGVRERKRRRPRVCVALRAARAARRRRAAVRATRRAAPRAFA